MEKNVSTRVMSLAGNRPINRCATLQLHRRNAALSGRVFTVGHCSVPPYSEAVLHCTVHTAGGRRMPSSGLLEGLTVFAENAGLVVE